MDEAAVTLRQADPDHLGYVERLLARNGLPTDDIDAHADCFFVAVQDGERVGVAGVESYPPNGLLRSVVVEESHRGRGLGGTLCDQVEARAWERGVRTLYLLTTTATDFFRSRGYERFDRSDAPAAIRETRQFAALCPSTATCLRKSLSARSESA